MAPTSPLLSPTLPSTFLMIDKPQAVRQQMGSLRLALLTVSILGVQMFWSILMAHGNPYLSSLGFSSALSSLVWLAGPLGGALVQPVVGIWSDNWSPKRSYWAARFGRRRPFMLIGALSTVISLSALAYVRESLELLGVLIGLPSSTIHQMLMPDGSASWVLKTAALLWVYVLNLAVQPLQVGVRAYVVDCVPVHQQVQASAWISRWNSFGAVVAFWLGSLDLPRLLSWAGADQFKVLVLIDALVLAVTLPVSFRAGSGSEDLIPEPSGHQPETRGLLKVWRRLYKTWTVMPHISWIVCKVQFWSWMAWFPFLYYQTLYIASLTLPRPALQAEEDPPTDVTSARSRQAETSGSQGHWQSRDPSVDQAALAAQAGSFASFLFALTSLFFTLVLPVVLRHVRVLNISKLWLAAQIVVLVTIESTLLVSNVANGTALFACLGFSWAMTQWAPYALISKEVSRLELAWDQAEETECVVKYQEIGGIGSILGLHNVAISTPQIIAAFECSALFGIFDSLQIHDQTGWVLRLSGLSALGAAWSAMELL